MTFKLSNATSYEWPVAGEIAGVRFSFKGQFAFLRQERIEELTQQLARRQRLLEVGQDDPDLSGVHARAVAAEVLVGWSGVTDDDGEAVPFSPATLEQMRVCREPARETPAGRAALARGWRGRD